MKFLFFLLSFFLVYSFSSDRWYLKEDVSKGRKLYNMYCISCHNKDAVGIKNWKKTDKNGFLPPPPLNGSAHAWHHNFELLKNIIQEGGAFYKDAYKGRMPPFKDTLSDKDIIHIIAYLQNFWSDEIYQTWIQDIQKNKKIQ